MSVRSRLPPASLLVLGGHYESVARAMFRAGFCFGRRGCMLHGRAVAATLDARILGSNRLKFTPDGKLVFITSLRGGDVVIYDATSRKEYRRVPVGHGAAGILMDLIGQRAFVACTPDNYVAVIDLKSLGVTGHVDVGGEPDGLAWAVRP